jgi:hypothetical protein
MAAALRVLMVIGFLHLMWRNPPVDVPALNNLTLRRTFRNSIELDETRIDIQATVRSRSNYAAALFSLQTLNATIANAPSSEGVTHSVRIRREVSTPVLEAGHPCTNAWMFFVQ